MLICITCVRCPASIEGHAEGDAQADVVSLDLIECAKRTGWEDREHDGWYCPQCARQHWEARRRPPNGIAG